MIEPSRRVAFAGPCLRIRACVRGVVPAGLGLVLGLAVGLGGCSGLDVASGPPGPPGETQTTSVACDSQHPECTIERNAEGTLFRINRPVVDREQFEYPQIAFAPGDRISFEVDGCVQTGGRGDTWHDYAVPLDDPFLGAIHPDALHWAAFSVPGVQSKTAFRDVLEGDPSGPEAMRMPAPLIARVASHLVLHFADDDYGDNGYGDHDDGEGDQCAGIGGNDGGPAYVVVHVEHGPVPPPSDPATDWDLFGNQVPGEPERFDDNGFRLNPRWGWQALGRLPPATTRDELFGRDSHQQRITSDNVGGTKQLINDVIRVVSLGQAAPICDADKGHYNWDEVTVRGKVYWHDHATDDDWNIQIASPSIDGTRLLAGTTVGNMVDLDARQPFRLINGEFDSDETVDRDAFDQLAWWRAFHDDVDRDDTLLRYGFGRLATHAADRISGHDAVMTGLMGLDTVHPPWAAELHPVHVLAIRTNATPDLADDGWAFFLRNFGNEGFCSSSQHYIQARTLTLTIPRPPGASTAMPQVRSISVAAHEASPEVEIRASADGVAVTATLAAPENESLVVGEIHLTWSAGDRPAPPAPPTPQVAQAAGAEVESDAGAPRRSAVPQGDPEEVARARDRRDAPGTHDDEEGGEGGVADKRDPRAERGDRGEPEKRARRGESGERAAPGEPAEEEEEEEEEVGSGIGGLLTELRPAQAARVTALTKQRIGRKRQLAATSAAIHVMPGPVVPGAPPATFSRPSDHGDRHAVALVRSYCDVTGGRHDATSTQLCRIMGRRYGERCAQDLECPASGRCDRGRCEPRPAAEPPQAAVPQPPDAVHDPAASGAWLRVAPDPARYQALAYGELALPASLAAGHSCTSDAACGSGHCVDGVCCAVAACGAGQVCNTDESPGSCAAADYLTPP